MPRRRTNRAHLYSARRSDTMATLTEIAAAQGRVEARTGAAFCAQVNEQQEDDYLTPDERLSVWLSIERRLLDAEQYLLQMA